MACSHDSGGFVINGPNLATVLMLLAVQQYVYARLKCVCLSSCIYMLIFPTPKPWNQLTWSCCEACDQMPQCTFTTFILWLFLLFVSSLLLSEVPPTLTLNTLFSYGHIQECYLSNMILLSGARCLFTFTCACLVTVSEID